MPECLDGIFRRDVRERNRARRAAHGFRRGELDDPREAGFLRGAREREFGGRLLVLAVRHHQQRTIHADQRALHGGRVFDVALHELHALFGPRGGLAGIPHQRPNFTPFASSARAVAPPILPVMPVSRIM